jgi:hypothetical protein
LPLEAPQSITELDKLPLTESLQTLADWTARQETAYHKGIEDLRTISSLQDDEIRDLKDQLVKAEAQAIESKASHVKAMRDAEQRLTAAGTTSAAIVRDLGERLEKAEAAVEVNEAMKARISELEGRVRVLQEESIAARVQGFEAGLRSAKGV